MPAIVIGDHCDGRVADLGLAGELGLGHIGHSDHVAFPRAVKLAFRKARELRAFHDEISTAALERYTGLCSRRNQYVADPTADRMGHRHMRDTPLSKKTLLPRKGAVDELIDDDKIAGLKILTQAANSGERYDVGYTAAFQRVNIGAKVDLGRRQHVTPPVAGHEYYRLSVE